MNEYWISLKALLAIMVWRWLSSRSFMAKYLQWLFHKLPSFLPMFFQWYVHTLFFFGWFLLRSMNDIMKYAFKYEFGLMKFPPTEKCAPYAGQCAPYYLQVLASIAPFAACLAFLIVTVHLIKTIRGGHDAEKSYGGRDTFSGGDDETTTHYWLYRLDSRILMVLLPCVYVVLLLRASIRIQETFTTALGKPKILLDAYWSLFSADLEVGILCEMITVLAFSLQMRNILFRHENLAQDEVQLAPFIKKCHPLVFFLMLGVYCFVVLGLLRSVLQIISIMWGDKWWQNYGHHYFGKAGLHFGDSAGEVLAKTKLLFTVMVGLLAIQMTVISKMKIINEHMPFASLKFNGTRLLIVLQQAGESVLLVKNCTHTCGAFHLSRYQNGLLHTSLMSIACLLVTVLNYTAWLHASGREVHNKDKSQPLLVQA